MSVVGERKQKQIIWLDMITYNVLHNIYVESGAYKNIALNEFISKIVAFAVDREDIIKAFLKEMYNVTPVLKRYSMYVEQIEVPKIEKEKVVVCPFCLNEFKDIKHFKEHLSTCAEYSKFTNNISKQV